MALLLPLFCYTFTTTTHHHHCRTPVVSARLDGVNSADDLRGFISLGA